MKTRTVHKVEMLIVQSEDMHDESDIANVISDLVENGKSPYTVAMISVQKIENTIVLSRQIHDDELRLVVDTESKH